MSTTQELQDFCKANQSFLCSLYKTILQDTPPGQNIFFSPFSISVALSMTLVGARGQTEDQMKSTLGFQELDQETLNESFKNLLAALTGTNIRGSSHNISIANGLFVRKDFQLQQSFVDTAVEVFGAESKNLDFDETSQVLEYINDWVKSATREKIPQLLDDVDPQTRTMIINAIYFKSLWKYKFDPNRTESARFYLTKNDTVRVKMMNFTGDLKHSQSPDYDVLELPYKLRKTSMIIFLPKEIDGLSRLESQLSPRFIRDGFSSLSSSCLVELQLPSFKLEQKYSLVPVLQKMGMIDLFLPGVANLTGLSKEVDMSVSRVVHQSVVEVNEKGTEAAAATCISDFIIDVEPSEPRSFIADHPFLFCIVHKKSGSILFMGSLKNPPAICR